MKIVINDLEQLNEALELRAKVNHHAAVKQAVAAKTEKKRKPYKPDGRKPVLAGTSNDGVIWVDEVNEITEEQYAAVSARPYPDHISATFKPDIIPPHIRDKMKADRDAVRKAK